MARPSAHVPGLEYALVCDRNEERLAIARQAFPGVQTCLNLEQVAEDPTIDLVIVSTPPNTHAAISMQMLQAGKHVVSEKPFCLTTAEADAMIQLAHEQQLALTVYQCRRWDPDFLAIQEIVQRGTIGDVFHMETFIGGYAHPCDYWHSHEPISGGVFYDWGSHYLDWILQLIPDRWSVCVALSISASGMMSPMPINPASTCALRAGRRPNFCIRISRPL